MENQIDGNIKEQRSKKLIELSNNFEKEYNESYIGKTVEVLWEEEKEGIYKGHTQNYLLAYYKPEKVDMNLENKITKANCISAESDHIIVEI